MSSSRRPSGHLVSDPPRRPAKEDRSPSDRIDVLLDRLDRTKDILKNDCASGDRFALLALGTLEKTLKDLLPTLKIIEQARDVDREVSASLSRVNPGNGHEDAREMSSMSAGRRADQARATLGDSSHVDHAKDGDVEVALVAGSRARTGGDDGTDPAPTSRLRSVSMRREQPVIASSFGDSLTRRSTSTSSVQGDPPSRRKSQAPVDSPSPLSPTFDEPPSLRAISRSASRLSSQTNSTTRTADGTIRNSVSKLFNRAKDAVSPAVPTAPSVAENETLFSHDSEEDTSTPVNGRRDRSSKETSSRRDHRRTESVEEAPPSPSIPPTPLTRRGHVATDLIDDERPISTSVRSRSRAGRASSRARSGRSEESKRALELASAPPPVSDDEEEARRGPHMRRGKRQVEKKKVVLKQEDEIVRRIVQFADLEDRLVLARVSHTYRDFVRAALYRSITITSLSQLDSLDETISSSSSLAKLVVSLRVEPLDTSSTSPSFVVSSLRRFVSNLPSLSTFEEDFTASEWDIQSVAGSSTDYPLTVSDAAKALEVLSSKRCWWEITAINDLVFSQPHLRKLALGGAAMDRDWEGPKLKAALLSSPRRDVRVESLQVAQVMHEDTLAVLLLLSKNPKFRTLRIGFQSIGSSDDDTPLASIPRAIEYVSSTLTTLVLVAPKSTSKVSEDTSTLFDECLPLLPHLEHLAFQETLEPIPIPLCSSETFSRSTMPTTLKSLTVRGLFSISTGRFFSWIDDADAIPVLEEIDVEWAQAGSTRPDSSNSYTGTEGSGRGDVEWYKARQVDKIRSACDEYGIKSRLSKGSRTLSIA